MNDEQIPARYARALFSVARENGIIERVARDLGRFLRVLEEERMLAKLFHHPAVATEIKSDLLDEICRHMKFSRQVKSFLKLLLTKKRLGQLGEIFEDFQRMALEFEEKVHILLECAHPLSSRSKGSLRNRLKEILAREIVLDTKVDPDLIGGLRVRFGDTVYDGSVKRKLELIREALAGERL